MEIRIGDNVKFLNEEGGGIVIDFTDRNHAIVRIEDGFEIPVSVDQLIITEPGKQKTEVSKEVPDKNFLRTSSNDSNKKDKESNIKTLKRIKGIVKPLFAFALSGTNESEDDRHFDLYLLNDGDYHMGYVISFEKNSSLKMLEKGELEPETIVSLGNTSLKQLLLYHAIVVDIIFYSESEYKAQMPVHYTINLKTLNLLDINYKKNDYFDTPAYLIDLFDDKSNFKTDSVVKKIKEKEIAGQNSEKKSDAIHEETEEIDLHIEEIVDNEAGLSNGEIINIQMARFTTALEGALKGKTRNIVFIHGVGQGKLRYELRKTLDTKYPDLTYQDASFAEYGYGATMVMIRK
jgi:hypothetical protein